MEELKRSIIILIGVMIYGTLGFNFFEGVPISQALFWTVMTISTVGYYGKVAPVTPGGWIIASTSVIGGLGTLLYILNNLFAGPMLELKLKEVFGMGVDIRKDISNHTVVTGYGDIGDSIAEELDAINEKFVFVEKLPDRIKILEAKKFNNFKGVVQGDATNEEILKKVYIEKAKNLILTSKDDANNVFITLTAKSMNNKLRVVTTASESRAMKKLYSAGADMVISSPEIGGTLLANASVRPNIVKFLQEAMTAIDVGNVAIQSVKIPNTSKYISSSIGTCDCKELTGALLVGIARKNEVISNPPNDFLIQEGDELILLGKKEEIKRGIEIFGK